MLCRAVLCVPCLFYVDEFLMPDDPVSFMFLLLASSSSGISDYAEIVEEEGDYSTPDGKKQFPVQIRVSLLRNSIRRKRKEGRMGDLSCYKNISMIDGYT